MNKKLPRRSSKMLGCAMAVLLALKALKSTSKPGTMCNEVIIMTLNIAKHETFCGISRGVYYFNVSDYPRINALELQNILAFINYEKQYKYAQEYLKKWGE